MKKDVLQDADAALATGSPLPADLALALDAMEQEEAQALDTAWTAGVDTSVPERTLTEAFRTPAKTLASWNERRPAKGVFISCRIRREARSSMGRACSLRCGGRPLSAPSNIVMVCRPQRRPPSQRRRSRAATGLAVHRDVDLHDLTGRGRNSRETPAP